MAKSRVLVTGGCGYIGSHVTRQLSERGYDVTVIDNLSTGFPDALLHGEKLVKADLGDRDKVERVFAGGKFEAVLHFAASIVVPESVAQPLQYYRNNTANTIGLLEQCAAHGVRHFVFSSTAAVYGEDNPGLVHEGLTPNPTNPYGTSKLMNEWILRDLAAISDFRFVTLRYFNVAGADPECRMGQRTPKATHLIKVACEYALGKRKELMLYGTDYQTPDGTCIRDYIHVEDLADAHLCALKHLEEGGAGGTYNCGYGEGSSVRQVIDVVGNVHGKKLVAKLAPRRSGDVSSLVADSKKIRRELDWQPRFNDLEKIVSDAYSWEQKLS